MSEVLTEGERRELESLREWQRMVAHAPEGAQDVVRARMLASQQLQPIVSVWRDRVQILEGRIKHLEDGINAVAEHCRIEVRSLISHTDGQLDVAQSSEARTYNAVAAELEKVLAYA